MTPYVPFVSTSETSRAAAESIAPDTNKLRRIVRGHIQDLSLPFLTHRGLTCDEVERITGLRHQTASARIRELSQRGEIIPLIVDGTPVRRPTRSGRLATVYVTKEVPS